MRRSTQQYSVSTARMKRSSVKTPRHSIHCNNEVNRPSAARPPQLRHAFTSCSTSSQPVRAWRRRCGRSTSSVDGSRAGGSSTTARTWCRTSGDAGPWTLRRRGCRAGDKLLQPAGDGTPSSRLPQGNRHTYAHTQHVSTAAVCPFALRSQHRKTHQPRRGRGDIPGFVCAVKRRRRRRGSAGPAAGEWLRLRHSATLWRWVRVTRRCRGATEGSM